MKSNASSAANIGIILGVFLLAGLLGWRQQQRLQETRQALAALLVRQGEFSTRLTAATARLEDLRQDWRQSQNARQTVRQDVVQVEKALAQVDPEIAWVSPPETLPAWEEASPYVWLRKDKIPLLPVTIFSADGELDMHLAQLIDLSAAQKQTLAKALPEIMAAYRAREMEMAEKTDNHPPGWSKEEEAVTVELKISPEESQQYRETFENKVRETVGEKRAELVLATGQGWLDKEFVSKASQGKFYSLQRRKNGSYNVTIRTGTSWMSTSVNKGSETTLAYYFPKRLLPLFSSLIPPDKMKKVLASPRANP